MWLGLLIGLLVGATFGALTVSLAAAGARADWTRVNQPLPPPEPTQML